MVDFVLKRAILNEQARLKGLRSMNLKLLSKILLSLLICSESAFGDTAQTSWSDANFAFCEGIGAGASGKVKAHAEYKDNGAKVTLTSFSLATSGHSFDHIASGKIEYLDDSSQTQSLRLQQPWFPVMGAAGPGDVLYLPKNKTSATTGPWEQGSIELKSGSTIKITMSLLFAVAGGNCPTSFSADWKLP